MSDCLPTVRWRQTAASHGDRWRQKEVETEKRRKWNNKTGRGQTARRRLPAPIMHQGAERGHAAGRTDRTDSAAVTLRPPRDREEATRRHRLKDFSGDLHHHVQDMLTLYLYLCLCLCLSLYLYLYLSVLLCIIFPTPSGGLTGVLVGLCPVWSVLGVKQLLPDWCRGFLQQLLSI